MDIRRILDNDKYFYIDSKTRKRIKNKRTVKRIKKLNIPPGYKKVKISSKNNSKVQAIGEDDLGRKQYIYNKKFIEEQQEIKFQDLINFGKKIKRIRKDYRRILESNLPIDNKEKQVSMVLFLLDVCKFRVGTEEYKKKYNTYGATTLNSNHIIFKENEVEISFIGKKSVTNSSVIKNENVIYLLETLCKKNKGKEYLFYYKDDKDNVYNITSNHIHNVLKKYNKHLQPKMFRTWNGNSVLLKYLISKGQPKDLKEIKRNLREGIKKVANELHNTVSVSKKSYCNSEIYTLYLNENDKFFEFLDSNRKDNGDKKLTDRILTLFLEKYYKNNSI
jgi:DNA topoisomerase-1